MNTTATKIETIKDYANTKSDIEWCITNLKAAKENGHLPRNYSKKLKEKLLEGFEIENSETCNSIFRRFDYPLKYVQNVMNPSIGQWNKWVILCSLHYLEDEFEDINNLTIIFPLKKEQKVKRKHTITKTTKIEIREHLRKKHGLTLPK